MTLQKIDERLVLYKEYLRYLIDAKINRFVYIDLSGMRDLSAATVMRIFAEQGFMIINTNEQPANIDGTFTFDQWLYQNKHEDLILTTHPKPSVF